MTTLEHDADDNAGPLNRAKLERELGKFGQAFGKGQNSRPSAAIMCVDAASRCSDVGPDDADNLYTKFSQAAAKSQGLEYAASASHKVQVSKMKRFLMLGTLTAIDGVDFMNRVTDKIEELSRRAESPLRGSAYDNMVKMARVQLETPKVALTDEQIEEALSAGPAEKTELDKVIDLYKKSYRLGEVLADAGIDHPDIDDATALYGAQIQAMGGDLPAMTKEDKTIAAAEKIKAERAKGQVGAVTQLLTTEQPSEEAQGGEEAAA